MTDPYIGREQTKAKHFILRRYLQALAFKVQKFSDITYVDGFSGPWQTNTEDFSDSSFMIAISVLLDAQKKFVELSGQRRRIRCFFVEVDPKAFAQLQEAVAPFHKPAEGFEIKTYCGKFEDAINAIQAYIGNSFPLIFVDPTGWTGYPFEKIKPLFQRPRCEVIINFMYEFINRFAHSSATEIIASLNPILGGRGWNGRLDPSLPVGLAVEKLFRETLKTVGHFDFVVSAQIDKATVDRPHFFITYGTKNREGLITFRQTQYEALRRHASNRATAKEKKREDQTSTADLFAGHEAGLQEATIEAIVAAEKRLGTLLLIKVLEESAALDFSEAVNRLLQAHMLRETNVKDICVELAKIGKIENTWGSGNRKPQDGVTIKLATKTS